MTRADPHSPQLRLRHAAAGLLGACAAYQLGLGAYFVVLRPPLLPEDLRFLGATAQRLTELLPRLEGWPDLVFAVLGGQMAALGTLVAGVALRLAQGKAMAMYELLLLGLAGLISVAGMSAVNFALGSDFRWLLILPVLAWALGLALAALGRGEAPVDTTGRA